MSPRTLFLKLVPILDVLALPFLLPAAWLMRAVRRIGMDRMPWSRRLLVASGVFPLRNHYYEPQFDFRNGKIDFARERALPGIDWNAEGQLALLARMTFAAELGDTPVKKTEKLEFYMENQSFGSGDAEYWYQLIRVLKPRRIIEIGSGNSTLMAVKAIAGNRAERPDYQCDHTCVEPFEIPWLEQTEVSLVREMVEDIDVGFFSCLEKDDILFIDSSHVIRPEGDVLFEYLQLLPTLAPGVVVHIHDIFSPRNYREDWLVEKVRFWNEQFLLEAFLTGNAEWEIIGAVNWLRHNHFERLQRAAPFLTEEREPGSFYIRKKT